MKISGGTVAGSPYTVTCQITTDEAIAQTDDRSFQLRIAER